MRDLHRYYEQGKLAFLTAGQDASCPYQPHTSEWLEWTCGVMDAATADDLAPEGHPV